MDEPVRWVTKVEAAQELEVSLSTLDRMIRKGEVEVAREGRRVYVRMLGPENPSDEELLRRAIMREDELERTVRELEQSASELERERDGAREAAAASRRRLRGTGGAGHPREDGTMGYQAESGRRRAVRVAGRQRSGVVASGHVRD